MTLVSYILLEAYKIEDCEDYILILSSYQKHFETYIVDILILDTGYQKHFEKKIV